MKRKYILNYPIFPFDRIPSGSKSVVIYGMGMVGTHYIEQVLANSNINLKYVVDTNWKNKRYEKAQCLSPDSLADEKEAVIVIAVASQTVCKNIIDVLHNLGIKDDRIVFGVKYLTIASEYHPQSSMYEYGNYSDYNNDYMIRLRKIRELLRIYKLNASLVRVGNKNDGGYVMIDDFYDTEKVAYSFGICDDVSWDTDIAGYGYDVYMYDHTISELPYTRDKFHFFKRGIAGNIETDNLLFLDTILNINHHQEKRNMLFKMDVEGAEWDFIKKTSSSVFSQFNQMVFEFHEINNGDLHEKIIDDLKKLNKTHRVIHVHANNYGNAIFIGDKPFPDTVEVTYANKESYEILSTDDVLLPIPEDAPCNPRLEELCLGNWNEKVD